MSDWDALDFTNLADTRLASFSAARVTMPMGDRQEPAYSEDPDAPTVWIEVYHEIHSATQRGSTLGADDPVRRGRIRYRVFIQPGAHEWRLEEIKTALRALYPNEVEVHGSIEYLVGPLYPRQTARVALQSGWWMVDYAVDYEVTP